MEIAPTRTAMGVFEITLFKASLHIRHSRLPIQKRFRKLERIR